MIILVTPDDGGPPNVFTNDGAHDVIHYDKPTGDILVEKAAEASASIMSTIVRELCERIRKEQTDGG